MIANLFDNSIESGVGKVLDYLLCNLTRDNHFCSDLTFVLFDESSKSNDITRQRLFRVLLPQLIQANAEIREIVTGRIAAFSFNNNDSNINNTSSSATTVESCSVAGTSSADSPDVEELDDDALLRELGVESETASITELRHVRSAAEKRAAGEIANREKCEDFEKFKPLFDQVQHELDTGMRTTRPFERKAEIAPGRFFVVGGQKAYVAHMDEAFLTPQGMTDARLRVIFDNGTESNMLMRSLQRALHKDEAGRRITDPSAGPLFGGDQEDKGEPG